MALHVSENLINYSAQVLVQPENGMTWTQIAKFFRKKGAKYNVAVPFGNTLYPSYLADRQDGFIRNLKVFSPQQQLMLLKELCDTNKKININPLKILLMHHFLKNGFPLVENSHE